MTDIPVDVKKHDDGMQFIKIIASRQVTAVSHDVNEMTLINFTFRILCELAKKVMKPANYRTYKKHMDHEWIVFLNTMNHQHQGEGEKT